MDLALKELSNLEFGRSSAVRDSLQALSKTQSLISDEMKESYHNLSNQVDNTKITEEINELLRTMDRVAFSDINNDDSPTNNEFEKNINIVSADYCTSERTKNFGSIFHKIQQTLEVLDLLKSFVSTVGITMRNVAEAKRSYTKSVNKCLEKQGFTVPLHSTSSTIQSSVQPVTVSTVTSSSGSVSGASSSGSGSGSSSSSMNNDNNQLSQSSTNSNGMMSLKSNGLKLFQSQIQSQIQSATGIENSITGIFNEQFNIDQFNDLLLRIESPLSISVWTASSLSFRGVSNALSQAAEKYFELFLPTLSSIQRRIYAMRNDLIGKQISNMKLIDNAQGAVLKLSQKIEKVRFLLKVQQEKVEKSKEEIMSGGSVASPGSGSGSGPGSGMSPGSGGDRGSSPPPLKRGGGGGDNAVGVTGLKLESGSESGPGSVTGSGMGSGPGTGPGSGSSSRTVTGSGSGLVPGDVEWESQLEAVGLSPFVDINLKNFSDDEIMHKKEKDKEKEREKEKEKDEKKGNSKASKVLQQGLDQFGSSLQKARMQVVAGLSNETFDERLTRREGRLIALECEEKELLNAFYAANLNMEVIEETVRNEIGGCLRASKEIVSHDMTSFVDILKQLSQSHVDDISIFENPIKSFEILCDSINLDHEVEHFTSSIYASILSSENNKDKDEWKNVLSDKSTSAHNPVLTVFTTIYSKVINDEKALLGLSSEPSGRRSDALNISDVLKNIPKNNNNVRDRGSSVDSLTKFSQQLNEHDDIRTDKRFDVEDDHENNSISNSNSMHLMSDMACSPSVSPTTVPYTVPHTTSLHSPPTLPSEFAGAIITPIVDVDDHYTPTPMTAVHTQYETNPMYDLNNVLNRDLQPTQYSTEVSAIPGRPILTEYGGVESKDEIIIGEKEEKEEVGFDQENIDHNGNSNTVNMDRYDDIDIESKSNLNQLIDPLQCVGIDSVGGSGSGNERGSGSSGSQRVDLGPALELIYRTDYSNIPIMGTRSFSCSTSSPMDTTASPHSSDFDIISEPFSPLLDHLNLIEENDEYINESEEYHENVKSENSVRENYISSTISSLTENRNRAVSRDRNTNEKDYDKEMEMAMEREDGRERETEITDGAEKVSERRRRRDAGSVRERDREREEEREMIAVNTSYSSQRIPTLETIDLESTGPRSTPDMKSGPRSTSDSYPVSLGSTSYDSLSADVLHTIAPQLPPRPPLPPRLKKNEGKDKLLINKDGDKDRERERGRGKSLMSGVDGNILTPNMLSTDVTNKQDYVYETDRVTSPPTILNTPNNTYNNQGDRIQMNKMDKADKMDRLRGDYERENLSDELFKDRITSQSQSHSQSPDRDTIRRKDSHDSPTNLISKEHSSSNFRKVQVPVTTINKPEDSNELVKFGLSPNTRILESFSCALYPKKGLLTHGR